MKKKKIKRKLNIKHLIIVLAVLDLMIYLQLALILKPSASIKVVDENNAEVSIKVSIESFLPFTKYYVAVDNNAEIQEDTVFEQYNANKTYELSDGIYYVHVKDSRGNVLNIDYSETFYLDFKDSLNYPFYPQNDEIDIDYKIIGINSEVEVSSSDENVAQIVDGKILTKDVGTTTISINSGQYSDTLDLEVTDLYTTNNSDSSSKPYLHETICTEEEAAKLDEVLEKEIEEAGYGTRAGVVAAARFLVLQFPYRITYFTEGGRLDPDYEWLADGEGRYYHKGLYLTEDKFSELTVSSVYGRATWGEYFGTTGPLDGSDDDPYLYTGLYYEDAGTTFYLNNRPNGLDCSGYVSWAYYNGGFDFGDIGAGGPGYGMAELGERVTITNELLQSDRIKAGDLVGYEGHVGIVIGVEDDYIWIADTLITGTKVTRYERNVESFNALGADAFQYFMLMDSEYIEDGNYTAMWD